MDKIAMKEIPQTGKFGHFSPDGLEYVTTRPDTPRPFDNFIWNKSIIANIQQTGVGYTDYQIGTNEMTKLSTGIGRICDFDVFGRDTFMNRLIYIRDNETGKFWNVGWEPVKAKYDKFTCRHGIGYTIIENSTNGVDASYRIFAPRGDEAAEYWTITLNTSTPRDLTVFVYTQISFKYMWGFNSYGDMFYRNSQLDEANNMMVFVKHPFVTPHNFQTGFLAADVKIDGFDGSKDFFVGQYNALNEPRAVIEGKCSGSIGSSDSTIAAVQFNLGKVEGEKKLNLIFGVTDSVEHAVEQKTRALDNVEAAWEDMLAEKREMFAHNSVETPDAMFNAMFNAWHKQQARFGAEWCRWGWMGYRDIVQHGMGVSSFMPERSREILLEAFKYQYASGLALRGWNPIDTKEYSDSALWLVFSLTAYLRETGDRDFLDIVVPFYDEGEDTVLGHIRRALDFLERNKGVHKLLLIKFGDWNDSLTGIGKGGKGESVWLSMAYAEALKQMQELYKWLDDDEAVVYYATRYENISDAINEHAWDGDWYVRGFDDDGNAIGSSKCNEGFIYLNVQSWSMISGVANEERRAKIFAAIDKKLKTPLGYQLMASAYKTFDPVIGRVTAMEPGICENATIYSHGNSWMVLALLRNNEIARAWQLYQDATPAFGEGELKENNPRFVYGNCYFGPEHRNSPYKMEFNWITGSISWFYNNLLDELLGVRREYKGIKIAPRIPAEWDGFKLTRMFRGKVLNVEVKGNGSSVKSVVVNGEAIEGNFICECKLTAETSIVVEMA